MLIRQHIKKISLVSEFVYNGSSKMREALTDCQSVLDVGCGGGDAYSFAHKTGRYAVGIDVDPKRLSRACKRGIYNKLIQADVRAFGDLFAPESFDAVVALDIVEHLPRDDSERLVEDMERIARKVVVIVTPNGKTRGHKPDVPYMKHLCGWTPDEFCSRGYRVWGIGGWKGLRNYNEFLRGFSSGFASSFQRIFFNITQPFVANRPDLAFAIICVLRKEK
ncbi:MAG: class I SAM-dependent methyltransferase [Desulfobacteraceae bacterium]|nr:class I SAM-dependent methyltransferase [Desulfobacteraceae bacterium]